MERISVLNPRSWIIQHEVKGLSPRLSSLSRRTIGIVGQGHSPMLYLKDALLSAVPDIKKVVILGITPGKREFMHLGPSPGFAARDGFTEAQIEEIEEVRPDAVIHGIAH